MIKYALFSLFTLFIGPHALSQSAIEKNNRLVYNRIEYFFNTQQTDSIYAMATPTFQKQVTLEKLELALQYFYTFGQIKDVAPVTFQNNIAGYNLMIGAKKASLLLQTDSTFHFSMLKISDNEIASTKKENIKSTVQKTNSLDSSIDSIAHSYIEQPNTQALAIGIIHKGKINTFFYGETVKGDSLSIPKENTLFELGSISKVFTASLLANLVENNIITLEDSITRYLPDSLANNSYLNKITFKELANHTSGLPRLANNLEKSTKYNALNPYAHYGRKELFSYLKDLKLENAPGEKFEYSNTGYALLGELLAIITKKTYAQYLAETITKPLGMPNTVEDVNPKTQQLAKVYTATGTETPIWQFQAYAAAGSIKSTVTDMLKFAQIQFKMPESALEQAFARTRQFTYYLPPSTDIGLAWHMNMTDDVIQYWHNGRTAGSSSFFALIPDSKSAVIVLSNSAVPVDQISTQIISKIINTK